MKYPTHGKHNREKTPTQSESNARSDNITRVASSLPQSIRSVSLSHTERPLTVGLVALCALRVSIALDFSPLHSTLPLRFRIDAQRGYGGSKVKALWSLGRFSPFGRANWGHWSWCRWCCCCSERWWAESAARATVSHLSVSHLSSRCKTRTISRKPIIFLMAIKTHYYCNSNLR